MSAFLSTPLIGLPQVTGWSQVYASSDHHFWVCFAIVGHNAGNVGRDVLVWLEAQQPSQTTEVHTILTQLLAFVRDKACDVQVSVAWYSEGTLVAGAVHGSVVLKRPTKVGVLLHSTGEVQLVQGKIQPGDMVVLLTEQAGTYRGEIQQKLVAGYDIDTIVTSLVPSVHTQADSSLTAFVFLLLTDQKVVVSEPDAPLISIAVEPDPVVASDLLPRPPIKQIVIKRGQFLIKRLVSLTRQFTSPKSSSSQVSRRKLLIRVGLVLLALGLVGGGSWWGWQRYVTAQQTAVLVAFQPWLDQLQAAEANVQVQPLEARHQASTAVAEIAKIAETYQKNLAVKSMVANTLSQVQARGQALSGQVEKQDVPIFYDARLLKTNFVTTLARSQSEIAWLVDKDQKQAIILDLTRKQAQVVDLSQMTKITDMSIDGDVVWLLGDGIWQTSLTTPSQLKQIKPEGDSNRAGILIGSYNKFVYVFNTEKRTIYRYAPDPAKDKVGEYTDPIGWLQSSQGLTLSDVRSASIDGDIWLGLQDGQIKKFSSGRPAEFAVQGLSQAPDSTVQVVTTAESPNLYVLEPNRARLLVIRKDGTFLKELSSPVLKASTDLLVQEPANRALVVSGSLLYELEL